MLKVGNMPQEKRALHALNRLAFGPRPGDLERVNQIGVDRYIREQLDPQSIPVPPDLARRVAALTTLQMTPVNCSRTFSFLCNRPRATRMRKNRRASARR
jgi:Protein of unknown function (DUF1800)